MKKGTWKPYVLFILLTEAVGALSALVTKNGVARFESIPKSSLTPPNMVFPIVWAVLFLLLGIGAARVWLTPPSGERSRGLALFYCQLVVNFLWGIIYFNMQAFAFAFFWLILLWLLVLFMTIAFAAADKPAAWLQVPYLLWLIFAGYLNYVVWMLNR